MTEETSNAASEIEAAVATAEVTPVAAEPETATGTVAEEQASATDVAPAEVAAVVEDSPQDFSGAVDQGRMAKALGLTEDACPYGVGENRDAWLSGFSE